MREIRLSGSEGGASQTNGTFLPLSLHRPAYARASDIGSRHERLACPSQWLSVFPIARMSVTGLTT